MFSRLALPLLLVIFALASATAGVLVFTPEDELLSELGLPATAEDSETGDEEEGGTEGATGDEKKDDPIELASMSIPATIPEGTTFVINLGLFATEDSAKERAKALGPRGPAQGTQEVMDANGRTWFMSMLGPVKTLREANRISSFVRSRHGAYPTIHIAPEPPKE